MPVDRSPPRDGQGPPTDPSGSLIPREQMEEPEAPTSNGKRQQDVTDGLEIQANEFRNVKLQTFWRNRPKLWFASLECEFTAYRVRSDDIKYSAVVRHLDEQTMLAVADVLEQPPERNKYDKLKNTLIERFSDSLEKQLRTLLEGIELGDKFPSVLLREMRILAGSNVTDSMLRTLWMQRLPRRLQELLAMLDDINLDKLAACADKAHERGGTQNIVAVVNPSQDDTLQALCKQVSELTKAMADMNKNQRRSRSRSRRSRSSTPNRSRTRERPGFCYNHRRFKEKAWKCQKPCSATYPLAIQENSNDRQQ